MNKDFGAGFSGCPEVVLAASDTRPSGGSAGRTRGVTGLCGVARSRSPTDDAECDPPGPADDLAGQVDHFANERPELHRDVLL